MSNRIILYGTTHLLQQVVDLGMVNTAELEQGRQDYVGDICRIISLLAVGTILEEANKNHPSLAAMLAEQKNLTYAAIDMPMAERLKAG